MRRIYACNINFKIVFLWFGDVFIFSVGSFIHFFFDFFYFVHWVYQKLYARAPPLPPVSHLFIISMDIYCIHSENVTQRRRRRWWWRRWYRLSVDIKLIDFVHPTGIRYFHNGRSLGGKNRLFALASEDCAEPKLQKYWENFRQENVKQKKAQFTAKHFFAFGDGFYCDLYDFSVKHLSRWTPLVVVLQGNVSRNSNLDKLLWPIPSEERRGRIQKYDDISAKWSYRKILIQL